MYIEESPQPMFHCDRCHRAHLSSFLAQSCCKKKVTWPQLPTQGEVGQAIAKLPTNVIGPQRAQQTIASKYPKYHKDVSHIDTIDVYGVCQLFGVSDASGALQHAIKKLLLSGVRTGGKSSIKDIEEARDTLNRYLEFQK